MRMFSTGLVDLQNSSQLAVLTGPRLAGLPRADPLCVTSAKNSLTGRGQDTVARRLLCLNHTPITSVTRRHTEPHTYEPQT